MFNLCGIFRTQNVELEFTQSESRSLAAVCEEVFPFDRERKIRTRSTVWQQTSIYSLRIELLESPRYIAAFLLHGIPPARQHGRQWNLP